jgi:sec-independent protein translocase protein TatC
LGTTASERKSFFKRISGKDNQVEESEMTFFDHIEELRWHIMRSIIAWLVAAIAIFIYIDWVYDNVILAPANKDFVTYGASLPIGPLVIFRRWILYATRKN